MTFSSRNVRHEPGAIKVHELKALLGKDNPVILEVGANIGQTTEEFLREMPNAKFYCFEPEPRAISLFKNRILSPQVKLYECAIGNTNGFITFNQSSGDGEYKDWNLSGSIHQPKLHLETWPGVKFETQIEVPIQRLDDWEKTENLETVDLVWADVQGAEADLIMGGKSVLRKTRFFYTEYGVVEWYEGQITLDEICDALAGLGFVLYRKFEMDALFINTNMNDLSKNNYGIGRNEPCLCGSGLRYKHCHGKLEP